MELKTGYKQTEVGVIPEAWQVRRLGDVGRLEMGKGLLKDAISTAGELPAIPYTSLYTDFDEVIDTRNISCFVDYKHAPYVVDSPCVLLASSSNVSANTGKACALLDGFPVAVGREVITLTTKQNVVFISYLLATRWYRKKTLDLAKGITIKHVYPTTFVDYTISLPSIPEQSAIAKTLSDVDALLAAQDALIAKKRAIKQGAMQGLLTGLIRLPGFSSEWKRKQLGDVIENINDGATPPTNEPSNFGGPIHWVVIDDIKDSIQSTQNTLTPRGLSACAATVWRAGTLIVSTGATIGEVGVLAVPAATKQGICGIVFDKTQASASFMKFWFIKNKALLVTKAQGSTIREVRPPTIKKMEIELPPLAEQEAIAAVLSDMDREIATHEARHSKSRVFKQGMMQELLTGRIRLV